MQHLVMKINETVYNDKKNESVNKLNDNIPISILTSNCYNGYNDKNVVYNDLDETKRVQQPSNEECLSSNKYQICFNQSRILNRESLESSLVASLASEPPLDFLSGEEMENDEIYHVPNFYTAFNRLDLSRGSSPSNGLKSNDIDISFELNEMNSPKRFNLASSAIRAQSRVSPQSQSPNRNQPITPFKVKRNTDDIRDNNLHHSDNFIRRDHLISAPVLIASRNPIHQNPLSSFDNSLMPFGIKNHQNAYSRSINIISTSPKCILSPKAASPVIDVSVFHTDRSHYFSRGFQSFPSQTPHHSIPMPSDKRQISPCSNLSGNRKNSFCYTNMQCQMMSPFKKPSPSSPPPLSYLTLSPPCHNATANINSSPLQQNSSNIFPQFNSAPYQSLSPTIPRDSSPCSPNHLVSPPSPILEKVQLNFTTEFIHSHDLAIPSSDCLQVPLLGSNTKNDSHNQVIAPLSVAATSQENKTLTKSQSAKIKIISSSQNDDIQNFLPFTVKSEQQRLPSNYFQEDPFNFKPFVSNFQNRSSLSSSQEVRRHYSPSNSGIPSAHPTQLVHSQTAANEPLDKGLSLGSTSSKSLNASASTALHEQMSKYSVSSGRDKCATKTQETSIDHEILTHSLSQVTHLASASSFNKNKILLECVQSKSISNEMFSTSKIQTDLGERQNSEISPGSNLPSLTTGSNDQTAFVGPHISQLIRSDSSRSASNGINQSSPSLHFKGKSFANYSDHSSKGTTSLENKQKDEREESFQVAGNDNSQTSDFTHKKSKSLNKFGLSESPSWPRSCPFITGSSHSTNTHSFAEEVAHSKALTSRTTSKEGKPTSDTNLDKAVCISYDASCLSAKLILEHHGNAPTEDNSIMYEVEALKKITSSATSKKSQSVLNSEEKNENNIFISNSKSPSEKMSTCANNPIEISLPDLREEQNNASSVHFNLDDDFVHSESSTSLTCSISNHPAMFVNISPTRGGSMSASIEQLNSRRESGHRLMNSQREYQPSNVDENSVLLKSDFQVQHNNVNSTTKYGQLVISSPRDILPSSDIDSTPPASSTISECVLQSDPSQPVVIFSRKKKSSMQPKTSHSMSNKKSLTGFKSPTSRSNIFEDAQQPCHSDNVTFSNPLSATISSVTTSSFYKDVNEESHSVNTKNNFDSSLILRNSTRSAHKPGSHSGPFSATQQPHKLTDKKSLISSPLVSDRDAVLLSATICQDNRTGGCDTVTHSKIRLKQTDSSSLSLMSSVDSVNMVTDFHQPQPPESPILSTSRKLSHSSCQTELLKNEQERSIKNVSNSKIRRNSASFQIKSNPESKFHKINLDQSSQLSVSQQSSNRSSRRRRSAFPPVPILATPSKSSFSSKSPPSINIQQNYFQTGSCGHGSNHVLDIAKGVTQVGDRRHLFERPECACCVSVGSRKMNSCRLSSVNAMESTEQQKQQLHSQEGSKNFSIPNSLRKQRCCNGDGLTEEQDLGCCGVLNRSAHDLEMPVLSILRPSSSREALNMNESKQNEQLEKKTEDQIITRTIEDNIDESVGKNAKSYREDSVCPLLRDVLISVIDATWKCDDMNQKGKKQAVNINEVLEEYEQKNKDATKWWTKQLRDYDNGTGALSNVSSSVAKRAAWSNDFKKDEKRQKTSKNHNEKANMKACHVCDLLNVLGIQDQLEKMGISSKSSSKNDKIRKQN